MRINNGMNKVPIKTFDKNPGINKGFLINKNNPKHKHPSP